MSATIDIMTTDRASCIHLVRTGGTDTRVTDRTAVTGSADDLGPAQPQSALGGVHRGGVRGLHAEVWHGDQGRCGSADLVAGASVQLERAYRVGGNLGARRIPGTRRRRVRRLHALAVQRRR